MTGRSNRFALATIVVGLCLGAPAGATPVGLPGMTGIGGVQGGPRVIPVQAQAGREARRRQQRPGPRPQTAPGNPNPENPRAPHPAVARPVVRQAPRSAPRPAPMIEDFDDGALDADAYDPRLEQFQGPPEQPDFDELGMGNPGNPGNPGMGDPRRLAITSPMTRGIRPEVQQRLQMVSQLVSQGSLEMATDFIPHPREHQLSGAERRGFDRLANGIVSQARRSARKEAKNGNIGAGRERAWRETSAREMQLPDYMPGTALDSLRAIDNLKDKQMAGGALSAFSTARALRKAEKSILGWTRRHFWQRRNVQATAAAVGALIERGASEPKIARAVKKTYGEFMTIAARDARTGDVDSSLAALNFLEMIGRSPDVPASVQVDVQRRLQRDDRKIRQTRLKAYKVGIQYMINMAARQRNMGQHESAEGMLGRVFYMARKADAVIKAGGADVPAEAPVGRDGQPLPISVAEVTRHLRGFGPNNLYTRRVLHKLMSKYGAGAQAQGLAAAAGEASVPAIEAELAEIDQQMEMLESQAEQAHGQLVAEGATPEQANARLEQELIPVFEQLMGAREQLAARLQGARSSGGMGPGGSPRGINPNQVLDNAFARNIPGVF